MISAIVELDAMKKVAEALEPLDADAQARVLNWAAAHFFKTPAAALKPEQSHHAAAQEPTDASQATAPAAFESIADLFAKALPGSDAEKALVAGYWLQFEQGANDFGTQEINSELKHLGYGVGNITRAFELLKATRPQQVIQLRKAGTSQQARKTFKLTEVGKQLVTAMIRTRGNV